MRILLAFAVIGGAGAAAAQTPNATVSIVPAQPVAGETVYATYTTRQPCASHVQLRDTAVSMQDNVIETRFALRDDATAMGCDNEFRHTVELGQLPAGNYIVEAFFADLPMPPFTVDAAATRATSTFVVAVAASRNGPLNNVTGAWYAPEDSGWSMTIYQQPDTRLSVTWATYDSIGTPTWFFLLPGRWVALNEYEAPVAQTANGPYFGRLSSATDPLPLVQPQSRVAGTARLLFGASAPIEAGGLLSYTIDGITTSRSIRKFVYR